MAREIFEVTKDRFHLKDPCCYILQGTWPKEAKMRACLDEDGAVGRRLDFLTQEMNREVNTIGSKASDLEITPAVVAAKSEIEKLREQVQNVE